MGSFFKDIFIITTPLIIIFFILKKFLAPKKSPVLSKKTVVLLTGACQGIGRQLAQIIASTHKCILVLWDIRDDLAPELIRELEGLGSEVHFFKCDVGSKNEIHLRLAETYAKVGGIDILINNAGIVNGKSFSNLTNFEFERTIDVNFMGPVWITKEVLAHMKEKNSGHIVNMCSSAALIYSCDSSDYCSSKAAIMAWHSSLRLEIKRENLNINTTLVCPSGVATGMFDGFQTPPILKPFFPWQDPKKVANMIHDGIMDKQEEIFTPFYHQILFRIFFVFPTWLTDVISLFLTKSAFAEFKGRRNQYIDKKKN